MRITPQRRSAPAEGKMGFLRAKPLSGARGSAPRDPDQEPSGCELPPTPRSSGRRQDGILKGKALERGPGQRPAGPCLPTDPGSPLKTARRAGDNRIRRSAVASDNSCPSAPGAATLSILSGDAASPRSFSLRQQRKTTLHHAKCPRQRANPFLRTAFRPRRTSPPVSQTLSSHAHNAKRKATFFRISLYWIPATTYPPGPFLDKHFQGFGMLS